MNLWLAKSKLQATCYLWLRQLVSQSLIMASWLPTKFSGLMAKFSQFVSVRRCRKHPRL